MRESRSRIEPSQPVLMFDSYPGTERRDRSSSQGIGLERSHRQVTDRP
jgi:hypothetical protein